MKEAKQLEKILKILGNRRRLIILAHLKKGARMTVGEIASTLKISFNATSQHLLALYDLDILEKEQRGLLVYYRIVPDQPKIVKEILSEL